MQVKVQSLSAIAGMLVSMTTPMFFMMTAHCLVFDYEVTASAGTPVLEIHTRMTHDMLSGKRIWTSQDYNLQRNKANLTLMAAHNSENLSYVLDFVGVLATPNSTVIRIATVDFLDGQCEQDRTVSSAEKDSGKELCL